MYSCVDRSYEQRTRVLADIASETHSPASKRNNYGQQGGRAALDILLKLLHRFVSWASDDMVIDHADCLHESVTNCWSYKLEAVLL